MADAPDTILLQIAPENRDLTPRKQHDSDAAYDLYAAEDAVLSPGGRCAVATGVRLQMPLDYVAEVRPRSGLALKFGVTVLNAPGTVDSGYRGEVKAILINHGKEPFAIHRGDRIAQLLFQKLPQVRLELAEELSASDRGEGGFGSTGR